ncbi:MAG TPA: hypothetical protein VHU79_09275 [Sphingomicrobium sp.]|jgi:hypothetical protein|nr:hypothetical protein [Sphingomicrobium sp.]
MTDPGAIAFEDHADEFVDQLIDDLLGGSGGNEGEGQDQDSGDSSSPPNFWLGPINAGPVTFGKPVDDPVTSGSDAVDTGPKGTVDNPGNSK